MARGNTKKKLAEQQALREARRSLAAASTRSDEPCGATIGQTLLAQAIDRHLPGAHVQLLCEHEADAAFPDLATRFPEADALRRRKDVDELRGQQAEFWLCGECGHASWIVDPDADGEAMGIGMIEIADTGHTHAHGAVPTLR